MMFYKISSSLLACALAIGECVAQVPEGNLVVYTATYPATLEQSEYPVHTDYTVIASTGNLTERVANNTGSFGSFPAKVALPRGKYRVRAQYDGGRFVLFSVRIEPGRTTTVDLTNEPLPQAANPARQPIRLPDGRVVGWLVTSG